MKNYLYTLFTILYLIFVWTTTVASETQEITLGAIYSLSGWGAKGGRDELNGLTLAMEEINNSGGINGKKIKIIVEDNRSDFNSTVSAINNLITTYNIPVILGPNWVEFTEVAAPIAQSKEVVMLVATGSIKTVKDRDYVFSILGNFQLEVKPIAEHIIKNSPKKLAVLKSANAYFEQLSKALKVILAKKGIKPIEEQTIPYLYNDFKSTILRLKQKEVDAVGAFLLESGELSSFIKQSKNLKAKYQIYSEDITYTEELAKNPTLAEDVIFIKYISSANQEFVKKFTAKYGHPPQLGSGETYDNLYLIKWAMEKCGENPKAIKDCLLKANFNGVCGKISFNKDGLNLTDRKVTTLYTVNQGKIVPLKE